jgi:hypothetical protein
MVMTRKSFLNSSGMLILPWRLRGSDHLGDIRIADRELQITLAPLSSPHRTRAAQALCEMLDQNATIFPGSHLRMRFAMRPPPRAGLAFPGPPAESSTTTAVVSAC